MNFNLFVSSVWSFFSNFYTFTDSIHPFSDIPSLSLFWLFESLFLTSYVWMFFPTTMDEDFSEFHNTGWGADVEPEDYFDDEDEDGF